MAEQLLDWRFRAGRYLGEISALSFLRFPSNFSSLPLLLAGCGSQMLLFDLELARIRSSFQVFEGIRVHGISSLFLSWDEKFSSSAGFTFNVAIFGERRVKLYRLCISDKCESLISLCSLPKFNYWVLDVCFLKRTSKAFSSQGNFLVAIGCSDNSIYLWDISESVMILKVDSSERCLLYSMRLWGDDIETLRIASGTIFNEIVVWRVVSCRGCTSTNQVEDHSDSIDDAHYLHHQYEVVNICRLAGHEGSIFRIAWSPDGSKLVSVSDDRSARVWTPPVEREYSENAEEVVVLFGHDARIWDCCIYDSLIITAGEDCTCRAWGLDGKQLRIIKEHMGRGVWRCLYDPNSLLLITAGFDSAIKVHQLDASFSRAFDDRDGVIEDGKREIFTTCIPRSLNNVRLLDSKSEYIRCLRFSNEATFYVATNHGFLYHVKLSETGDVNWTELVCLIEEIAIVCMDLLPERSSVLSSAVEDWIAVGDGRGKVTVVKVMTDVIPPKVSLLFNWQAESERQLLGTFWCKSLGPRYIFTANPRGLLKLWELYDHAPCDSQNTTTRNDVSLEAEFMSCFGMRILCLDASLEEKSLLCGDLRGNLILFPLPMDFLSSGITVASGTKISPSNYFKGAHGISTVTSVAFAVANSNYAQIRSTGGDGCICHLEFNRGQQKLEFIGMRQVKELSLIQSISSDRNCFHDLTSDNYATGFASTDFTIWNLVTKSKVLQINCGGWRRPHSYYLGDVPELKNCFAYVKDEIIYIHRSWDLDSESRIYPLNMHVQFHGRELHSLCFISECSKVPTNKSHDMLSKSSWIATGCEDGTVRLTRYTPGTEGWSASNLLGEHVGGSAVRAICSVSKIHSTESDGLGMHGEKVHQQQPDFEGREDLFLLISVGAKRVLTSWIQKCRNWDKKQYMDSNLQFRKMDHDNELHLGLSSPFTFQWLSSDMPMKCSTLLKKSDDDEKNTATNSSNTLSDVKSESLHPRKENMEQKHWITEKSEDDLRYMAVTAFFVRSSCSRFSVCFVVVACSDATLTVRALILPHRLWFDVFLVPLSSPILALQHVVIPKYQLGNIFIVISGATDGSIAFWDLTEGVEAFMQQLSTCDSESLGDYQKRPRTGRGSQGGRWWRSLNNNRTKLRPTSVSLSGKGEEGRTINTSCIQDSSEISSQRNSPEVNAPFTGHSISSTTDPEAITSDLSFMKCEIHPMHVLKNVHQSGVNCLHVSTTKLSESHDSCFVYNVVSGGDDQGLSSLTFEIKLVTGSHISEIMMPEFLNSTTKSDGCISDLKNSNTYRFRFPNLQRVDSAHSSAVKGVWTDGNWVFSAGLDQRMRCWRGLGQSKLFEYAHLIISVPEPEAIDVRLRSRNHYQIAVAGRGLQIIEFSASTHIDP